MLEHFLVTCSQIFSKFVQGTVYAFEPVLAFILAKLGVERNQLRNVVLQNAALGSTCGTCLIRTQESPSLHCGGSAKYQRKVSLHPCLN